MDKKYQIFISSTYSDLKEQRDQVIKSVLEMGHIPVGMEMFSAADEEQWKIIQRTIDECDYYIVIVAHRYGSEVDGIGYTEKEYDYALECNIPIMGFIIDDKTEWNAQYIDQEAGKVEKLKKFKHKVKEKPVGFWKNTEDVYGKASIALMKQFNVNPRVGWIKADRVTSEQSTSELLRLRSEIDEYKAKIQLMEEKIGSRSEEYAHSTERVSLEGLCDVLDVLNSKTYKKVMKHKNVQLEVDLSWATILGHILPALVTNPTEQILKNTIGLLIKESLPDACHKKYEPDYVDVVKPSRETYDTIKIQLLALGYGDLQADLESKQRAGRWILSDLGRKRMYELKAQKSGIVEA
ncbi:DUF4062 domain-containing protein [Rubellicoccus peritrichatus]|uniref:DUF4062 domain-containing protein n=1 Tax=Rubellicoccus peritrichatus TaxID=3080537 RepID=A0AAQ3QXK1_9BACT|nr:DUF4062 domain-containing protein [Puniceicoccus sp. CR14]WOO43127.1 DUF4062 domain-containing protein [Puniceicoccus sp. CR14]